MDLSRLVPKSLQDELAEKSFFETPSSNADIKCPMDFTQMLARDDRKLEADHDQFQRLLDQNARSVLINQDFTTIPDDKREELMRMKRKDDAYKTALCDAFRRTNACAYGDQCRFAHGVDELRVPSNPRGRNHPKYKTVLCDKFSTTGQCKYGTRCQFIHKAATPALIAQTNRLLTPSSTLERSMNQSVIPMNQSMFSASAMNASFDIMNQSLPINHSDVTRAFSRANVLNNDHHLTRLTRHCLTNPHNIFGGFPPF